jgi:hypothetical protein
MKTADLDGQMLEYWVAEALGATAYQLIWPDLEQVLERYVIQMTPIAQPTQHWFAMVIGRPGDVLRDGPWQEGTTPRAAVARAIVAARFGLEV